MESLHRYLVEPDQLRQWVWPQELDPGLTSPLQEGTEFFSRLGSLSFGHRVIDLQLGQMQLLVWGAADGFCQWSWGNGWVQLRLEAVSLLPLGLGQVILLQRLQEYARMQRSQDTSTWPGFPQWG